MHDKRHAIRSWSWWATGYLCRMVISADSKLNAKIVMNIKKTSSEKITVFLQPNHDVFPKNLKNRQILENNQIYYR